MTSWLFRRAECGCEGEGDSVPPTAAAEPVQARLRGELSIKVGSTLLDRYEVTSLVGSGSWGSVYLAQDNQLKRNVAIKCMHESLLPNQECKDRFEREAEILSGLSHAHLCTIYDRIAAPTGQPIIIMEYIVGESLSAIISREKQISVRRTLSILTQVCDGLGYAHKHGVVHRDLKPENIILTPDQCAKIVDFGLAQFEDASASITVIGQTVGTPSFMSPEQCRGCPLDQRSDIYSLGAVLFLSLTGTPVFAASNFLASMHSHVSETPRTLSQARPDLYFPDAIEAIVARCLEKEPEKRFANCEELKEALSFIGTSSARVRAVSGETLRHSQPSSNSSIRTALLIAAGMAGGAVLVGLSGGLNIFMNPQATNSELRPPANHVAPRLVASPAPASANDSSVVHPAANVATATKQPVVATHTSTQSRPRTAGDSNSAKSGEKTPQQPLQKLKPHQRSKRIEDPHAASRSAPQIGMLAESRSAPQIGMLAESEPHVPGSQDNDFAPMIVRSKAELAPRRFRGTGYRSDDDAIAQFPSLNDIQFLTMCDSAIGDKTLAHAIRKLPAVRMIDFSHTNVSDDGLAVLTSAPNLRVLRLNSTKVTDKGLALLSNKCPRLLRLHCNHDNITDAGVEEISKLPLLLLQLNATDVTNRCTEALSRIRTLETLTLTDTPINNSGLAKLRNRRLRQLDISGTDITDEGLSALKDMPSLRTLNLSRTRLTEAGLATLATVTELQRLDITGLRPTPEVVAILKSMPMLKAVRWGNNTDPALQKSLNDAHIELLDRSRSIITLAGPTR